MFGESQPQKALSVNDQRKAPWVMPVSQSKPFGGPFRGTSLPGVQNETKNPKIRAGFTRPKSREVGGKNA